MVLRLNESTFDIELAKTVRADAWRQTMIIAVFLQGDARATAEECMKALPAGEARYLLYDLMYRTRHDLSNYS
jgi:hypothetical protein